VEKNFKNSQSAPQEPVADITDDAARIYSSQLMTNLGEQGWEKLKQVDEALEKIEDGSYGTCSTCDQPIPEARLDVQPFARYCVECLSKIENEAQNPAGSPRENISEEEEKV
jgi:DnaK suppressor protein